MISLRGEGVEGEGEREREKGQTSGMLGPRRKQPRPWRRERSALAIFYAADRSGLKSVGP